MDVEKEQGAAEQSYQILIGCCSQRVVLWFVILPFHLYHLIPYSSHDDTHERTEQVEETIGKIDKGRDAKHRALRHTARIPRHQHRCHRHRIFGATTKQPPLKPLPVVHITKDIAREQDAKVLVGYGQVEH